MSSEAQDKKIEDLMIENVRIKRENQELKLKFERLMKRKLDLGNNLTFWIQECRKGEKRIDHMRSLLEAARLKILKLISENIEYKAIAESAIWNVESLKKACGSENSC